ncbi:hypothetical protein [Bacillus sp. FJAT-29814]|uniref:hypothetical protein n=1 Tax=Bacillus sp. FJAT-29814 TaxID=1729688 RepID=UPI000835CCDF|nr:hypothetical protein [Bacillus sp. FJAT-29814]
MNVTIELHYISAETKIMQGGSFPLRRRKPEQVAYEFWREIRNRMPYGGEIEKVIIDGEDRTEQVKILEVPLD